MRLWIDSAAALAGTTDDGDIVLEAEDFYFFKRSEISNEEGFHLEFANDLGGFELYLTYDEFNKLTRQMHNKVLEYCKQKDY